MSVSSDDADTIVPSSPTFQDLSLDTSLENQSGAPGFFESTSSDSTSTSSIIQLLDKYSKLLCAFCYDEAKSLLEKQASQKNADAIWVSLLHAAIAITVTERQYTSLSFLAPKGFLRKESNLKSSLEHLKQDLGRFSGTDYATYASELCFLVSIRIDQMEFYEKLSLLGLAKNVEIDDLLSDYEVIFERYTNHKKLIVEKSLGFRHILILISWEVEILYHLLKAHSSMQVWDFFSSVISSQEAHKQLNSWAELLQLVQNTRKSSFLGSSQANPALYIWLVKLRAALLSKFSLYFYDILNQQSNSVFDMKVASAKLQMDYYMKISNFVKKSDGLCVCLIFDARDVPYNPKGYTFPSRLNETPTGVGLFPAVLAVPSKPSSNHWPSVVMLLNNRFMELDSEKLVGFFDAQFTTSYFILKIDVRMYMLAIYESKKSEKDSYVLKFMQEMNHDLKCGKIFASLRSVAK